MLKDSDGDAVVVQQGESSNVVISFQGTDGADIVKANLISLTATLFDLRSNDVINSRDGQNVLDANNGTVATDGTLTLRLGPLDNVIVNTGTPVGGNETHCVVFVWTWNDGVEPRTGKSGQLGMKVERVANPD